MILPYDQPSDTEYRSPRHPSVFVPSGEDFERALERTLQDQEGVLVNSQYRHYDQSVIDWFRYYTRFGGRSIPTLQGEPMKAYAEFNAMFERNEIEPWVPIDGRTEPGQFPLPFCCVTRGKDTARLAERNAGFPIRKIGVQENSGKRRLGWTRYPSPITIPYRLELYARMRNHVNYVEQQLEEAFWNGVSNWRVKMPFSTGQWLVMPITDLSKEESTELEEEAERLIRLSIDIKVEAWIFFDLMQAPAALRVIENLTIEEDERVAKVEYAEPEAPPSLETISQYPKEPS